MRATILALALSCLLATPLCAAASTPTAGAEAAASQELSYFVGRWHVSSFDPQTGERLEIAYVVEPTSTGAWFAGAGSTADGAFGARDMWGRDPRTGELMRVIFDASGAFATVRARAWDGDRLVLEGDALSDNGAVRVRETITRISANRFDAVWEARLNDEWVVYAIETVTRQS